MEYIKYLIAVVGGVTAAALKLYAPLFLVVSIMMIFDFVTGIIAAKMSGEGWNSKVARAGVAKKGTMLIQLAFGVALDYVIPMAVEQVGLNFEMNHLLFSSIIGFYIIFTEAVSVCENFYEINPHSFPKWIIKLLSAGKDQLEQLGDVMEVEGENNDENLH